MEIQELVLDVDGDNHDDFLGNEISILNFFSDWHMGCLMALPVLESLAEEFFGKICFGKINVDECEEIAEKYEISKIPCLIVFKNGEIIEKIDNCESEEVLREMIYGLV